MTKLLTSVRNLEEAKIVCQAGSDWLDLKEPNDGALGAVSHATVAEVVAWANLPALGFGSRPKCGWLPDMDVTVRFLASGDAALATPEIAER